MGVLEDRRYIVTGTVHEQSALPSLRLFLTNGSQAVLAVLALHSARQSLMLAGKLQSLIDYLNHIQTACLS
jgi:hypothetical protein